MLKKIYSAYLDFISVYFYPLLFGLGFLVSLSYSFTCLDAYHVGGIVYRGILSLLILLIAIPLIIKNHKSINKFVIIFSAIFFLCNILASFISPVIIDTKIDVLNSILGIGSSALIIVSVLLYFSFKEENINEKVFKITTLCFLGLVFIMCLYTYIFEYKDIYNSILNEYGWNYDVTSIFKIKTEYGNYLLVGAFLSFVYFKKYNKKLMFCAFIFFFINMFISRSKTSIVISIPILFSFLYILIKDGLINHRKETIIISSTSFVLILTLILLCIFNVGFFASINYFFSKTILNDGVVVVKDRLNNWSHAFSQLGNAFGLIFGYGERVGPRLINGCGDNYYLYSFVSGGLIRLSLYLFLVAYCIRDVFKSRSFSKQKKIVLVLIQGLILLIGLTDTVGVVGFTYAAIFFGFIFFNIKNLFQERTIK